MKQLPSQPPNERGGFNKKPDWMTQEEWDNYNRHVWNDLQARSDNISPRIAKILTEVTLLLVVCVILTACGALLRLFWELIH